MKITCGEEVVNITEYSFELYTPLVVILFVTILPILILNFSVIYTVFTTSFLRTPSKMLLCSLAFSDFCIGLVTQPAGALFFISAFKKWHTGFCICWVVITRVNDMMVCIAFMTLAAMSIDRCLAVRTMTNYKNIVTKKRTVCLVLFIWLFGFTGTILSLQFFDTSQIVIFFGGMTGVFFVIITASFLVSHCSLKRLLMHVSNAPINATTSGFNVCKYQRSLNTMALILMLNILIYSPIFVFILMDSKFHVPKTLSTGFLLIQWPLCEL